MVQLEKETGYFAIFLLWIGEVSSAIQPLRTLRENENNEQSLGEKQ